jgi:hypothetical protein
MEQIYKVSRFLFPEDGNVQSLSGINYVRIENIALLALAKEHNNGAVLV